MLRKWLFAAILYGMKQQVCENGQEGQDSGFRIQDSGFRNKLTDFISGFQNF